MITDKSKKFFRIVTLFLVVSLAFSVLCSCAKDDSEPSGEFLSGEPSAWDQEHPYDSYAIVLPINCSTDVHEAIEALATKLAENTGAFVDIFYSHETIPSGKKVCHIFIGDTGDEASQKYLGKFRAEDKGYRFRDDVVHIGGCTEESLLSAIELFKNEIVVYADKEFFMNDGKEAFIPAEYDVSSIKLAGVLVGEYTLVYPQGNLELREMAEEFRDALAEASGFYLSIKSDSDVIRGTRAILLGNCKLTGVSIPEASMDDMATVSTYSSGIMIMCEEIFGIRYALDELLSKLLDLDANKSSDVRIESYTEYTFDIEMSDVFTLSSRQELLSLSELLSAIEILRDHQSDIYRIEGICDDSMQYIFDQFSGDYQLTKISDGMYTMSANSMRVERLAIDGAVFTDYITSDARVLSLIDLFDTDAVDVAMLQDKTSSQSLIFTKEEKSAVENIFSFADSFWQIGENDGASISLSSAFGTGERMWGDNTYASSDNGFYYSGFSLIAVYID